MIRAVTGSGHLARAPRYLTVGALCAVTHNVIMIGADFAGLHYVLATFISFLVLTPMGYLLHCRFTFRQAVSLSGFLRFTGGIIAAYPLSLGLMVLFCTGLEWPVPVAAPLTTVLLIVYNYVSAHWAILRRWRTT
jgi:putative flippase GtrA